MKAKSRFDQILFLRNKIFCCTNTLCQTSVLRKAGCLHECQVLDLRIDYSADKDHMSKMCVCVLVLDVTP